MQGKFPSKKARPNSTFAAAAPRLKESVPKADTYGGVIFDAAGRTLLREVAGHWGGYAWTFAKGRPALGETPDQTALREVLEETGCRCTIFGTLPRAYVGDTSTTAFYLMAVEGERGAFSRETAAVRWVSGDEARELIGTTSSKTGRLRDLTVLDDGLAAFQRLPYMDRPAVRREDWQPLQTMPMQRATLRLERTYQAAAMQQIRRGFLPVAMEQKWFIWFDGHALHLHRSWTGFEIFTARFLPRADGSALAVDADVNRDPEQYGEPDLDVARQLLVDVIDWHLVSGPTEPFVDGLSSALQTAAAPGFLGSPEVIGSLVDPLFQAVVAHCMEGGQMAQVIDAQECIAAALATDTNAYMRMPGWHSEPELGHWLVRYCALDPDYCRGENLHYLCGEAMASISNQAKAMLRSFKQDPNATFERDAMPRLADLRNFVIKVLLGTNVLEHGDRTLADFTWTPVQGSADGD